MAGNLWAKSKIPRNDVFSLGGWEGGGWEEMLTFSLKAQKIRAFKTLQEESGKGDANPHCK